MAVGEVTAVKEVGSITAKNVAVFIDADNLNDPTALDYVFTTLNSMAERVLHKRAYGRAESLKGLEAVFWRHGVRPVANLVVNKVTTDTALTIDVVEAVCTHKIDAIAICSGDADFVPLATWLRERGCYVFCFSLANKIFANPEGFYDDVVLLEVVEKAEPTVAPLMASVELTKSLQELQPPSSSSLIGSACASTAKAVSIPLNLALNTASEASKTVQQVLDAFPELCSGEPQHLSKVVAALRQHGILDKNTKTSVWFAQFPSVFKLLPHQKPNQLVYNPTRLTPLRKEAQLAAELAAGEPALPSSKAGKLFSTLPAEVERILKAVPSLRYEPQMLNQVVPVLRAKTILGKTSKSTEFFVRHADYFKLIPAHQPTQVAFLAPIQHVAPHPHLSPISFSPSSTLLEMPPVQDPAPVFRILVAAPEIRAGLLMDLGSLSNKLFSKGVISAPAEGRAMLEKYPSSFRLLPPEKPNAVQYIGGKSQRIQ